MCVQRLWAIQQYDDHYGDVIMGAISSLITSLTIVYSTVYSDADRKKTSKLLGTGLCVGNSPGTGEFPAQMASNAENVSIWWRHHAMRVCSMPKTEYDLIRTIMCPAYGTHERLCCISGIMINICCRYRWWEARVFLDYALWFVGNYTIKLWNQCMGQCI